MGPLLPVKSHIQPLSLPWVFDLFEFSTTKLIIATIFSEVYFNLVITSVSLCFSTSIFKVTFLPLQYFNNFSASNMFFLVQFMEEEILCFSVYIYVCVQLFIVFSYLSISFLLICYVSHLALKLYSWKSLYDSLF